MIEAGRNEEQMEELALVKKAKVCFPLRKKKIYIGQIQTKFAAKREMESLYAQSDGTQQKMKLHPAFSLRMAPEVTDGDRDLGASLTPEA